MKIFDDYVKEYDLSNDMIKRKYSHSYRVQGLCELIAKELGMNKEEIKIASLIGLFHDIGRFKQVKEYHTFDDLKSFDHGNVGASIFKDEFAKKLDIGSDETILIKKAIKYHNKLTIGNDVDEKEKVFCNIVRDADKIDILYQIALDPSRLEKTDGPVNENCRKAFMNKESINIRYVKNGTEKNILTLAYIWDINFDISKKIIKDNKYYKKIKKELNNEIYDRYFWFIDRNLEVK